MSVKAFVQITVVNTYNQDTSTTSQIIEADNPNEMERMIKNLVDTYQKLNINDILHHLIVTVL